MADLPPSGITGDDPIAAAAAVLGDRALHHEPLGPRTTYRVGGPAALLLEAANEDDLALASRAVQASGLPVLVVGNGSNLLVADGGFPGLAIALTGEFEAIEILDGGHVRAGAAVSLPVLARRTAREGLAGFEWAVGVPGTVGGAVRMNAGGHGSDLAASLVRARIADLHRGEVAPLEAPALELGYRTSALGPHHVVCWAELRLGRGDPDEGSAKIADIVRWRRENQPGGQNAGSVFTNPPGDSAGRLVDACGAKGLRVGSACVSQKHANFIQADEGGSADDVFALIMEVQRRVEEHSGIRLHPELHLVGFDHLPTPPAR